MPFCLLLTGTLRKNVTALCLCYPLVINHSNSLATLSGKAVQSQGGKKSSPNHIPFPMPYLQLTVWQHRPVYYSGGLYHVVVPLIPWNAWNCQTAEVLTSPERERKKIKRQSCRKYISQRESGCAVWTHLPWIPTEWCPPQSTSSNLSDNRAQDTAKTICTV